VVVQQDVGKVVVVLVSTATARCRRLREQVAGERGDADPDWAVGAVERDLAVVVLDVARPAQVDGAQFAAPGWRDNRLGGPSR
jgi:hypothetical protein